MITYYMTTVYIYIYTNCIHCFGVPHLRSPASARRAIAFPIGNPRRVLGFPSGELISFWARWSSASKFGCGGRGGDGGDGDITSVWPTETDGDKWPGALCWIGNWRKFSAGWSLCLFFSLSIWTAVPLSDYKPYRTGDIPRICLFVQL